MKKQVKPKGYILHEDSTRVVIATMRSLNRKTGDMVQVWILAKAQNPVEAVQSGHDAEICGDCPLRGMNGAKRVCYVNVGQAPLSVWKGWIRGRYPKWCGDASPFVGRTIRWGAYGDPVHIPLSIIQEISAASAGWTGYTHQWRNPLLQGYRSFLMASADTADDATNAHAAGWRTFRVSDAPMEGELLCLSESVGRSCSDCKLCAGTSKKAKSIYIPAHGSSASYHPSKKG